MCEYCEKKTEQDDNDASTRNICICRGWTSNSTLL